MEMRGTYFPLVSAQESAQRVEEKEELQITEEPMISMSVVGARAVDGIPPRKKNTSKMGSRRWWLLNPMALISFTCPRLELANPLHGLNYICFFEIPWYFPPIFFDFLCFGGIINGNFGIL